MAVTVVINSNNSNSIADVMRLFSSDSTVLIDDEAGSSKGISPNRIIDVDVHFADILDCSFLNDAMVLHLTSKCLPSDRGVSLPAVSFPMRLRTGESDSLSVTYALDNGLASQIAVLSAVAKRLQWKSIGFVTDGSGGRKYKTIN